MKESDTLKIPRDHKPVQVCLIGDGMVGKTKLAQAFTGHEIADETKKLLNTYTGMYCIGVIAKCKLCMHKFMQDKC